MTFQLGGFAAAPLAGQIAMGSRCHQRAMLELKPVLGFSHTCLMIFALASAMFSMGEAFTCSARLAWRGAFEEFGRSDRVVTVTAAPRRKVVKALQTAV